MGTCVSRCYPCSSSPPSTAGDHSLSLCGGDSPHLHTAKHGVAVHPLPLASNSTAPTTSTSSSSSSSSSVLSAASSSNSMATSSSSATTTSYSSSSSSRPFSAGYLKVRTCREMEVVVLDPNKNKRKLSRPASATPRPLLPRTPPALSVVRSPTKKKPGTTGTGRRATTPTATATRRVRPLLPRAPPAGAGGSASCRKKRLSTPSSSCRSADLVGRRKSALATTAVARGVGGGELVDDLNNPLISMDCFIFL